MFTNGEKIIKPRKNLILGFVLILLAFIIFFVNVRIIKLTKPTYKLAKLIEHEKLDDLSLTIYYISPDALTRAPVSVDQLVNAYYDNKVVVNGIRLQEHIDLLNQLINVTLIPVEHESRVNARYYYVFETKKNGKIFDVCMWSIDGNMFVNGVEVKENDVFYDVVMPFLPKDAVNQLEINKSN